MSRHAAPSDGAAQTSRRSPRVVVVTGASSGIGRATCLALAEAGDSLVLAARGCDDLEGVAAACRAAGADALVVPTDVKDAAQVQALVDAAVERHGRVDAVVHAAMVMAYGTIEELPLDVLTTVIDTATHGTAHVARAALPQFRAQEQGTLVVVTSLLASLPIPGIGAYVTGKWGQQGLVEVLRLETRGLPGIRVCSVAPGAVDTPIYPHAANYSGFQPKPPPPVDQAEKVARAIVDAVDGGRSRRSVGLVNGITLLGFRIAKPIYERLIGPFYEHLARSDERVAPSEGNVFSSHRERGEAAAGDRGAQAPSAARSSMLAGSKPPRT